MTLSLHDLVILGLSQAILTLAALLFMKPKTIGVRLLFVFYLCLGADLLSVTVDMNDSDSLVTAISAFGHNLVPCVFWLTCLSLFSDRFRLKSWHLILIGFVIFAPMLGRTIDNDVMMAPWLQWLFITLPQWLKILLVVLAIYTVASNWRDDLIQVRRYLRLYLLGIAGIENTVMLIVFQIYGFIPETVQQIDLIVLCSQLLLVNLAMIHLDLRVLFQPTSHPPKEQTLNKKDKTLDSLLEAMQQEQIYRQEGLTIVQLSKHLVITEARLRDLINQKLGYRNFNDFLNFYRINEITERLENPDEDQLPIMSIALDVGYRSMSPFNKAFKSVHGITPSEYRRHILQNRIPAAE